MKTKNILLTISILFGFIPVFAQKEANKFIAKNPNKTFVGAVLDPNSINSETHKFIDFKYPQDITITLSLGTKSQKIRPNYKEMTSAILKAIKDSHSVNNNISFSYDIKTLKSYDDLNWYFGQRIDPETFFGISKDAKPKITTVLLDITKEYLSINMDFPEENQYQKNPEIAKRFNELIYVGSITFGHKLTVMVESNLPENDVISALKDALKGKEQIAPKSRAILSNSNIRILTFDHRLPTLSNTDNPFYEIIKYINQPITAENYGIPLYISASKVADNSLFVNKY